MKVKSFAWYLAPGFSIVKARNAFAEMGVSALQNYDEISVRRKQGWKRVKISLHAVRISARP